jgi:hypothetical protein
LSGTCAAILRRFVWLFTGFILLPGQSNSKAAQGRRSPKIAQQSQNTKFCFIALFELIATVSVDKITICKKREVKSQNGNRKNQKQWEIENEKSEAYYPELRIGLTLWE